jgi:hypothetical protein
MTMEKMGNVGSAQRVIPRFPTFPMSGVYPHSIRLAIYRLVLFLESLQDSGKEHRPLLAASGIRHEPLACEAVQMCMSRFTVIRHDGGHLPPTRAVSRFQ